MLHAELGEMLPVVCMAREKRVDSRVDRASGEETALWVSRCSVDVVRDSRTDVKACMLEYGQDASDAAIGCGLLSGTVSNHAASATRLRISPAAGKTSKKRNHLACSKDTTYYSEAI